MVFTGHRRCSAKAGMVDFQVGDDLIISVPQGDIVSEVPIPSQEK